MIKVAIMVSESQIRVVTTHAVSFPDLQVHWFPDSRDDICKLQSELKAKPWSDAVLVTFDEATLAHVRELCHIDAPYSCRRVD